MDELKDLEWGIHHKKRWDALSVAANTMRVDDTSDDDSGEDLSEDSSSANIDVDTPMAYQLDMSCRATPAT
ncbi:hypothetical protein L484_018240 [Morus notabilis]|uniref:Uncharacterized protein n=1 Tax=Morus notabilis TaxID=981085 RepID=W9QFM1_9ROSA|nr:hypothetical protein L484_018240 [Morus notabilis]